MPHKRMFVWVAARRPKFERNKNAPSNWHLPFGGRLFLMALIRAHFLNWEILIPILPIGIFLPAASVRAMSVMRPL
jgi:hypothetical protein